MSCLGKCSSKLFTVIIFFLWNQIMMCSAETQTEQMTWGQCPNCFSYWPPLLPKLHKFYWFSKALRLNDLLWINKTMYSSKSVEAEHATSKKCHAAKLYRNRFDGKKIASHYEWTELVWIVMDQEIINWSAQLVRFQRTSSSVC